MNRLKTLTLIFFLSLNLAAYAQATTAYAGGKITQLYVSGQNNFSFRVFLNSPFNAICTGGFAFVNSSNGNYQVYVSTLTSAAALGKPVSIWANQITGSYCEIQDVAVSM